MLYMYLEITEREGKERERESVRGRTKMEMGICEM